MQEAKSKRDLIWEQKKRAREALLQNGGGAGSGSQNIPENNPPQIFAKKSPVYDNHEPEIIQPTKPLGSQDTNRTRKFANVIDDINNKPASQPSNNHGAQVRDFAQDNQPRGGNFNQQPTYSDQEPVMQSRRNNEEAVSGGARPNFNPTHQPSGGYEPLGRESREGGIADPRKKKADYGEELRNQMKTNQMKKQQEKNEIRNSQNLNQQQGDDHYFKEADKRRKEEYGDFLKLQMQAKQDSKKQEFDKKAQLIQSLENQDYNPYGRGGAGAPNQRNMAQPNYPPQQQQQQQQPPSYGQRNQQQVYPPAQQQQQSMPRQPERLEMQNDPYAQRQGGYAMERAGSVEPLQRQENGDYGRGNSVGNVDGMMPSYQRGNTIEGGERGKRKGFESEDPMEMAKKDRMKQDFQKGLQEQVEFKKRQKEMEKQRQLQEDRMEEERIRKEQGELAKRQAEEDPKKKVMAKLQNMEQNANNLIQQQQQAAKERPNRNRGNVQSFDQQTNPSATANSDNNQFQSPPSFQPNQQPPFHGYHQQQPPPYYPPPYGHAYPYGHPYPPPYGHPYPQPYGYPGHPGPHPYYNPQQPASFPSIPRNEMVSNELQQIRNEMQNQQAVLAKQVEIIKKEALTVMDGRDKAEQELLHLREKLKDKINHDQAYGKNLRDVLERNNPNAPIRAPRMNDNNPVRAIHRDPEPALEAYSYQAYQQPKSNKANPNPGSRNNMDKNYEEFTFPAAPDIEKPAYDVRRTNQKMMDDQHLYPLDDSYMPALDIEKTLSGNTKMIPLSVFDNKQGLENTRSLDRDPLTLSKIHNFASSNLGQMHSNQKNNRPNSSKQQWQKDEDSIDFLIKAHGPRPGSSESHGYGDTSHLIGRRLDEASELLKQVDVMNGGRGDRTNLRSRDKDTLSMAGRNILGDKQSMNIGNYGGKRGGGGYPESERGSLISRGDEGIRMNNHDLLPDLSMASHQAMDHFNNPADNSLMNMTGTSFNVDRINLANEARLQKWDSVGGGSIRSDGSNYDKYGGGAGRGNYYNRGGGLEAIQEDDDAHDNMAKIDKMLGGYLKTHEDLQGRDDHRY